MPFVLQNIAALIVWSAPGFVAMFFFIFLGGWGDTRDFHEFLYDRMFDWIVFTILIWFVDLLQYYGLKDQREDILLTP